MSGVLRGLPLRRWLLRRRDESGFTLIELLVAMGVFGVVIVISTIMLRSMTQTTIRVTSVNDARVEADRLYSRLDKQVPYAAAINPAALSGGSWWIEFRTDVDAGGQAARCWQYRLDTTARELRVRSWPPGNGAARTGWTTLVTDVRARTGGGAPAPFTLITSTPDIVRQRLVIALDIAPTGAPVVPLDTTYVARNTSLATVTNTVGQAVCPEVARS